MKICTNQKGMIYIICILKNMFVYTYACICRNNCEMIPKETGNGDITWVGN